MNIEINQEAIEKMAKEYAENLITQKVNSLFEQKEFDKYIRNTLYHAIHDRITIHLVTTVFKTLDMERITKLLSEKLADEFIRYFR